MKKGYRLLGLIWCVLAMVSCSSVTIEKPLPKGWEGDPNKYSGAWSHEDGAFYVKFREDGTGVFATLDWDDDDDVFEVESLNFVISEFKNRIFLSMIYEDLIKKEIVLAEVKLTKELITVILAEAKYFEELVLEGKFKGTVVTKGDSVNVILKDDPEKLLKELVKLPVKDAFPEDRALLLKRVSEGQK